MLIYKNKNIRINRAHGASKPILIFLVIYVKKLSTLWANLADGDERIFSYSSKKIGVGVLCELSPMATQPYRIIFDDVLLIVWAGHYIPQYCIRP